MSLLDKAIILLEDGTTFIGTSFGAKGTFCGQIVFNTSPTGHQEILTDSASYKKIVVMSFPHVGNYGFTKSESQSDSIKASGLITNEFSKVYSREMADGSLEEKLIEDECIGLTNVDTRTLTKYIRKNGEMKAVISSENFDVDSLKNLLNVSTDFDDTNLTKEVTIADKIMFDGEDAKFKIAIVDFGFKKALVNSFTERACDVTVFPASVSMDEIKNYQPNGIVLSSGPGNPAVMTSQLQLVKDLIGLNIPILGIGLGHQLIGLAKGATVEKLFIGHRGMNHSVKDLVKGCCEITSQNTGYTLNRESVVAIPELEVTYEHLNSKTIEGMRVNNAQIMSVQFNPEASSGPHDSIYIFDDFINEIKQNNL